MLDFLIPSAYAQCPVCVITVGGGLFIAKKLGIDDLLVSIWISGLNTALAFWIANLIKKKFLNNPYVWSSFFLVTTIFYLLFTNQMGLAYNKFLGIDKVLFGLITGQIIAILAIGVDKFLRSKNQDKVFFPYQKVVVPLVMLIITTLAFMIVSKK